MEASSFGKCAGHIVLLDFERGELDRVQEEAVLLQFTADVASQGVASTDTAPARSSLVVWSADRSLDAASEFGVLLRGVAPNAASVDDWESLCQKMEEFKGKPVFLVIDSLTTLRRRNQIRLLELVNLLRRVMKDSSRSTVLLVIRSENHPDQLEVQTLVSVSEVRLTVNWPIRAETGTLTVHRRRPSRRTTVSMFIIARETAPTSQGYHFLCVSALTGANREADGDDDDPLLQQLDVPFDLSIRDTDRATRARVQLPFVHRDQLKADASLVLHPKELQVGGSDPEHRESDSNIGEDPEQDWDDDVDV